MVSNLIVGMFVFLIQTFIGVMSAAMFFIFKWKYNKVNNIDITIVEMTKNGYKYRTEKGRKEFEESRGWRFVTAVKFGFVYTVKDNLGCNITDDDLIDSMNGSKRKALMVCMKDGLTSTFEFAERDLKLNKEEKKQLETIMASEEFEFLKSIKKITNTIVIDEIPRTLSLTPIKTEQTRFSLDAANDAEDIFGISARKRAARNLFMVAVGILVFSVVVSFVILVIMVTQGPNFATDIAANTAARSASRLAALAPGIPG